MKDIFLTSTFRNDWNKNFNLKLIKALEGYGYSVYAPQRDSEQADDRKNTFLHNVKGIDEAKSVLAVGTKTQTANWGFEIGYAFRAGKPVIIITDPEHPVELMPESAAARIIVSSTLGDIDSYFGELSQIIDSFVKV